jgi:hypothetical protein
MGAKVRGWLAGLVVLAVGSTARLALFFFYPPAKFSDSSTYRWLADRILDGWKDYNGTRTPGYPLFMALLGSDQNVYLVQLVLGVAVAAILFYIGWRATGSPWFGAMTALGHALNVQQIFFEASLLSESLTAFWIALTALGVFLWMRSPGERNWPLAIFTGTAAGLSGLTRPLFVFLPFWAALVMALADSAGRLRLKWRPLAATILPGLLIIGTWVNFIHSRFAMWNLSTLTGYQLVQHTGYFFEYVPDQYAAIRDTYLRYRDERIREYGTQGNAIWAAIPDMMKASGMGFTTLDITLTKISLQLIWQHPGLYLKTVWSGWWMFWLAPVYWRPEGFSLPGLREAMSVVVTLVHFLLIGVNTVFLASSLAALVWRRLRKLWRVGAFPAFLAATVWLTSVLQTLPDHGDNPRFLVPLQSLVVFWVIWIAYHWSKNRHEPLFHKG